MALVAEAADRLVAEHERRERFTSFPKELGVDSLAAAYAVQGAFVERLRRRGGAAPVGYKIGLTSPRMQAMCGIGHPIAGVVLDSAVHRSGAALSLGRHVHLGIEFEVGVRMGRDLEAGALPRNVEELAGAVAAVGPALELVEDRHADYGTLDVLSLVADNSWNAGVVLGDFRSDWPDLGAIAGTVERDGETIDRGSGRDALGHPFEPVLWLAGHLAAGGGALRRGDLVLTGSLVPTRFPKPGERYRFALDGLGAVEVGLEP